MGKRRDEADHDNAVVLFQLVEDDFWYVPRVFYERVARRMCESHWRCGIL